MDFPVGLLGLLQITTLPGLIVHQLIRFRGNLIDRVLVIFGLSLLCNYCLVILLTISGIYTRSALTVLLIAELIALLWLYRGVLTSSVDQLFVNGWSGLTNRLASFLPGKLDNQPSLLLSILWLGLVLIFAVRGLVWAGRVFISNLGSVFSAWDAVVSWNNWATVWAAGQIPESTHFYPQLVPTNWSITYALLGEPTLQFFAKSIMPLFGLLIFVGLFSLGFEFGKLHFFVAAALLAPLLDYFLKGGVSNGYVDIAVAFWGFMVIYWLLKARAAAEPKQQDQLLLLGAVFVAGAAATKQSGVYLALCYPLLAWVVISGFSDPTFWRERFKKYILGLGLIYLIWAFWYVFKEIQILTGTDRPHVDVLINLSSNVYENVGIAQQFMAAIGQLDNFLILIVFILLAFVWMDRFYRALTLLILPYLLLWAWIAAYDTRNLGIFLPIFALLSGVAISILVQKSLDLLNRAGTVRVPVYIPLILVGIILASSGILISPTRLQARQETLQKQIFSPEKNQMLYDLIAEENLQTRILTNYPMEYLPGLAEYQSRFDFGDKDVFLARIQDPAIEYLLFSNLALPGIRDYIESKIQDGSYQLVWENNEWKKFTLVKILQR